jgi:hypothetical protein
VSTWRTLLASLVGRARHSLIPLVLGLVGFFAVTGGRVLAPGNIAWITDGDAKTYFLGWHFYRFSPWAFPIGANPRYGDELSSAIVYVDNVPLLAILFKIIGPWLPDPFQYFGLWLLVCFVLQAWFAWLLVGLATRLPSLRGCATALFVLAPPFLYRSGGHYAMAGQWLLLASLYVCFGPRRLSRGPAWPALAFTACVVHSYITAMVLGLWLADLLRRLLFEGRTRADILQMFAVPALVVLGFWQAGLFMMGAGMVKSGFGKYRMNVLSLVDPSGWSYLLKDVPEGVGDYEGFNYLGLGALWLCLAATPALKRALPGLRDRRRYWPLLALLIGLAIFAVSNRVGIAGSGFEIPLPQGVIDRANALRGSGRMFWAVFYVILWSVVRAVLKLYPPRWAGALLVAAVLLQAVDTSAGWLSIRQGMSAVGSSWPSPLKSAFWSRVPERYRRIHLVLPKNQKPGYDVFAYFAATHGMATDAVYTARVDQAKLKQAERRGLSAVSRGEYEADTLYVLDPKLARSAQRRLKRDRDLLERIDGYWIVAPGYLCTPRCADADRGKAAD